MSKNLKTCRTKKLISSAVLCAAFSFIAVNDVLASTNWEPKDQTGNISITGDLNVAGDGNIYRGSDTTTLSIIQDTNSGEKGDLNLIDAGFINDKGVINIENAVVIDDYSALYNSGSIIANTIENYGGIGGITYGTSESFGDLILKEGGISLGSLLLKEMNLDGGVFDNQSDLNNNFIAEIEASILNINKNATFMGQEATKVTAGAINNKGNISNFGTIEVSNLTNTGNITGYEFDYNDDGIIDATGYGDITIKEGTSSGSIMQDTINITGGTEANPSTFTNASNGTTKGTLTAQRSLTIGNNTTLQNYGNITVSEKTDIEQSIEAKLTNNGTINNLEGALIETARLTNNGTINLTGSKLDIYHQMAGIGGTLNVKGGKRSDIFINGDGFTGNVNITENSTLYLNKAEIERDAVLNVEKGSIVHLTGPDVDSGAEITINANDSYKGDVIIENGSLDIDSVDITFGKESTTTSTDDNPYLKMTSENSMIALDKATVSMQDSSVITGGDIVIGSEGRFNSLSNSFTVHNLGSAGLLNTINGTYENYQISDNLAVIHQNSDKTADFAIDIYAKDSSSAKYDSFGSDSTIIMNEEGNGGTINISDWSIQGDLLGADAPTEQNITLNIFNGKVIDGQEINFTATDKKVLTPIGYYGLKSNGDGSYTFGMTGYNPTAFRGQITKIAQYQNQLAINDMLFNHSMVEQGFKGNDLVGNYSPNRYASARGVFAPYQYSRKDGGLWLKTYANFERLNMNHGLSVGNNAYGSIIGADFGLKELNNGWSFIPTAYVGYNGANQHWNGTRAYQNGAQIGFMGSWYKDNLVLGALTYAGMYGNSMETLRGTDETMNYFAGAATKAAYNYKLTKNLALQPNLLLAYSYFGQENWHTDFGQMGMMSGMLHGINIAPGLNLIWEKDTFSAYATVQYMYNVNQSTGGRTGNIDMANVHMDRGYLQYGVGANKKFTDKFSGYLQTVVRNVGRTGIAFMLGFNWKVGKDYSNQNITTSHIPNLKNRNI